MSWLALWGGGGGGGGDEVYVLQSYFLLLLVLHSLTVDIALAAWVARLACVDLGLVFVSSFSFVLFVVQSRKPFCFVCRCYFFFFFPPPPPPPSSSFSCRPAITALVDWA